MRMAEASPSAASQAKAAPSPSLCPGNRGRKRPVRSPGLQQQRRNPMNPELGARILVIEDELPMRTALQDCLETEGYRVLTAAEGETGLGRALKEKPDLILLDIMLPRLDGFALCEELRRVGHTTPVLMLTAKGFVRDRVRGLDAGADDYLVKPFSTDELLARVRALLRRAQRPQAFVRELSIGDVQIDFVKQTAIRKRKPIHFTTKEFAMLRLLAEAG